MSESKNNLSPKEVKAIQLALESLIENTAAGLDSKIDFKPQAHKELREILHFSQSALTKIVKVSGSELKMEPYHEGDEHEFIESEEPSVIPPVRPYQEVSGREMREMGMLLQALLPDLGWALLVFPSNEPGVSNYIANAQREDMITALREAANRLAGNEDFLTPEKQVS